MRIRSDGEQTRHTILAAACEVFGELGYHKATFARMGRRGDFNPALISFHFRSKEDLYQAVWETLQEQVRDRWPADGGLPADAPPEAHLEAHIRSTLNRLSDPDLGALHRIDMQERIAPTGLVENEDREQIQKRREHMRGVIQSLLGENATENDIDLCEMSIINQLFVLRRPGGPRHHHDRGGRGHQPPKGPEHLPNFTSADVERLTDHITRFSLGGIAAVREAIGKAERES